jgi:hypothetical protein
MTSVRNSDGHWTGMDTISCLHVGCVYDQPTGTLLYCNIPTTPHAG